MLVWIYTCQNATLLEIICHGSSREWNSNSNIQIIVIRVHATNAPLECNMLSYIYMKARDHHFTILNCDIAIMDFAAWNVTRFDDFQPPWSFIPWHLNIIWYVHHLEWPLIPVWSLSDCRFRGREFDPGPVPYFRGDWSWNNFYGHFPPFRWFIQEGLLSVTSESMCTNYWLTACSSLPRKKCG